MNFKQLNESFDRMYNNIIYEESHITNEALSDDIRKGNLDYDDEIDAHYKKDGNVEVQFQDRNSNLRVQRNPKDRFSKFEKQPRTSSHTWGRVWKDGNLVKSVDDSKYGARQEIVKYLDDNELGETLKEDASKEWKPNTSFAHIKKIYNDVKNRGYKYVNNESEEMQAAVKKADNKGYTPEQRKQIRSWHEEIWRAHKKNESLKESMVANARHWLIDHEGKSSKEATEIINNSSPEELEEIALRYIKKYNKNESLNESTGDLRGDVYNSLSDVCYEYHEKGHNISKVEMEKAIYWFLDKFFEFEDEDFEEFGESLNESYNYDYMYEYDPDIDKGYENEKEYDDDYNRTFDLLEELEGVYGFEKILDELIKYMDINTFVDRIKYFLIHVPIVMTPYLDRISDKVEIVNSKNAHKIYDLILSAHKDNIDTVYDYIKYSFKLNYLKEFIDYFCKKYNYDTNSLNESYDDVTSNNAFDILYDMVELYGCEEMLDALAKAMGNYDLADNLTYICRQYDYDPNPDSDDEDDDFDESLTEATSRKKREKEYNNLKKFIVKSCNVEWSDEYMDLVIYAVLNSNANVNTHYMNVNDTCTYFINSYPGAWKILSDHFRNKYTDIMFHYFVKDVKDIMLKYYSNDKNESLQELIQTTESLTEERCNYGHEGPFWYYTKHGLGPGMIPPDVKVVDVYEDGPYDTWIALDGVLTTQELKYYDLKEQTPPFM